MKKNIKLIVLVSKYLARDKIRTGLTVGSLTVATAVIISAFGFDLGYWTPADWNLPVPTNIVSMFAIIAGIIFFVAAVVVMVVKRTRDLTVFRALGASRSDVFILVWLETVTLCGAGGALGGLAAYGGSYISAQLIRRALNYTAPDNLIEITPGLLVFTFAGAVVLGIAAAALPAARAVAVNPAPRLRQQK